MKSRQKRSNKRSKTKRSNKRSKTKRSNKRSKRSVGSKRSKQISRTSKHYTPNTTLSHNVKNENITYIPTSKKFILNHRISSHQRNIFFKNKINGSLGSIASSNSPSCGTSLCSGK